ncbi:MAG: hypothetical protein JWQ38_3025 [Flavipsychrobacter sp.]|nr:hypothetical protein [Flavipsychrobacter sp.]
MKRTSLYLSLICLALYSCKGNGNKDMLLGTWHSQKIENPEIDLFFINSQKYIDTVGKANDVATNIALYGVANMDSMRKMLQLQFDSVKLMQAIADTQTVFRFEKDSVASLVFPDRTESGKWYFDIDGSLILEGATETGEKETSKVQIMTLDETTLKLKFVKVEGDATDTSYVTFKKEAK